MLTRIRPHLGDVRRSWPNFCNIGLHSKKLNGPRSATLLEQGSEPEGLAPINNFAGKRPRPRCQGRLGIVARASR